ncbi:GGDEF domain-containing protein [Microbispora sp. H10836]|uniref:GGDEF domain-containing protein n=1 Tax=Microbispora sp. H10836 TaxID=2729106 RepID=UPI0014735A9D|nr:GGDEF domain-containing protein [Microbispora sp. H10836]
MTATGQTSARPRSAICSRSRWPLLAQPPALVSYVCAIVAFDAVLIAVLARSTAFHAPHLVMFAALTACGAVCIEATRRLGMPAGVSRDLLSAWWLPVAFLLPPVYALLAPIPMQILLQLRVRATVLYRRVFSAAAIGLAAASASAVFHRSIPVPAHLSSGEGGPIAVAAACAVLFTVLNTALIAVAAHASDPEGRWGEVLWDRERVLLDAVELCLGVLVAAVCGLNLALLLLVLPPVVLLQRSLLHAQLQAAARTDPKTGLLNAAAWQREADTEIVRAQRTGDTLALVLVDIDHFKKVNDTYGHLVGDQVLAQVAATLRTQLREYDVVGRFGGEEFVVLLPGADVHEARRVAERLRARVGRMVVPAEQATVTVTVSAGVAIMNVHGEDLIELLAAADLALYRAKELGRDRVCLPAAPVAPPPRSADGAAGAIP